MTKSARESGGGLVGTKLREGQRRQSERITFRRVADIDEGVDLCHLGHKRVAILDLSGQYYTDYRHQVQPVYRDVVVVHKRVQYVASCKGMKDAFG